MKPLAWPGSPLSDLHLCQKNQLKSLRWPRTIDVYKHVLLPKIMLSTVDKVSALKCHTAKPQQDVFLVHAGSVTA